MNFSLINPQDPDALVGAVETTILARTMQDNPTCWYSIDSILSGDTDHLGELLMALYRVLQQDFHLYSPRGRGRYAVSLKNEKNPFPSSPGHVCSISDYPGMDESQS